MGQRREVRVVCGGAYREVASFSKRQHRLLVIPPSLVAVSAPEGQTIRLSVPNLPPQAPVVNTYREQPELGGSRRAYPNMKHAQSCINSRRLLK